MWHWDLDSWRGYAAHQISTDPRHVKLDKNSWSINLSDKYNRMPCFGQISRWRFGRMKLPPLIYWKWNMCNTPFFCQDDELISHNCSKQTSPTIDIWNRNSSHMFLSPHSRCVCLRYASLYVYCMVYIVASVPKQVFGAKTDKLASLCQLFWLWKETNEALIPPKGQIKDVSYTVAQRSVDIYTFPLFILVPSQVIL